MRPGDRTFRNLGFLLRRSKIEPPAPHRGTNHRIGSGSTAQPSRLETVCLLTSEAIERFGGTTSAYFCDLVSLSWATTSNFLGREASNKCLDTSTRSPAIF